ncbi:MAG: PAS domain S-box protein [Methylophaga sp.]|nr:PAS domain S-box protein [Methylophaga sp.]
MSSVNVDTALEALKKQFNAKLKDRIQELHQLIADCNPETFPEYSDIEKRLIQLHRVAHSLIGTAGSFKLDEVCQLSRQLEAAVRLRMEKKTALSIEHWSLIHDLIETLDSIAQKSAPVLPDYASGYSNSRDLNPLVYIIEDDLEQAELLTQILGTHGFNPRAFTDLDTLREVIGHPPLPDALVLDMSFAQGNTAGAQTLEEIKKLHPTCPPAVILSANDDFDARLAAIRAGASRYLMKPVQPQDLISVLDSLTGRQPPEPYRVIIVDDDSISLDIHKRILQSAGIDVVTLQQPERVFDILKDFKPDVLILDVFMPYVSGPELAVILREHDDYLTMPVIFLSADSHANHNSKALLIAGDQFLEKTVAPDELVAAVKARAKRSRQHSALQRRYKSLLYERDRVHTALNHHALISITDAQGNITYANDAFCRTSGYTSDELIGQNHRIIKSSYHEPDFYSDLWKTISDGQIWTRDICNERKDGGVYWVHTTITPFLDESGKPYQYVSIRTDITSLKLSEEKQRAQNSMHATLGLIAGSLFNASPVELDTVINNALQLVCEELENTCGTIFFLDAATQSLIKTHEWCPNHAPTNLPAPEVLTLIETPLWWSQLKEGEPIYIPDAKVLHPDAFRQQSSIEPEMVYGFPLRISGGTSGFLCLRTRSEEKKEFKSKIKLLALFSELIASAITRTKSQAEAEQAKERLRLGQLYANIGTWEWNIKNGEIYWTEQIAPMLGLDHKITQVSYTSFLSAIHPDDLALVTDKLNACIEKDEPYEVEHRVIWPDGTERWLLERGSVERDHHGDAVKMIGVVQDINDRKIAEIALSERESQLLEAQRLASIGHWHANMKTGEISWSDEIFRIFGQSKESFTPSVEAFHKSVHPDDLALVNSSEDTAAKTGKHDVIHRIIRPDGSVRHVHELAEMKLDEQGMPELMKGTVQDVTDRVIYQQRLQIFKHVIDAVIDGVIIINSNGVIEQSNPAACEIFGYTATELEGEKLNVLMPEPHAPEHDNYIRRYLNTNEARVIGRQIEVVAKRSDGSLFPMEVAVSELKTQNDLKFVGLLRDISERKRVEKKLIDTTLAAEKASKAKSEFLSSMSHELRTPLNAILGFAQLMEYDSTISDIHQDNLKEIIKAGSHLLELINEILDLAKIEAGEVELSLEQLEVSPIIEQCLSLLKPLFEKNTVEIQHNLVDESMVLADKRKLKQVLLNLLSNAIKYNRPGGRVSVNIQRLENGFVRIAVDDTGYGIPKDMLEQLFQPFNRANAENTDIEGTGIGLTITKRLVEFMSGQVGVDSQEGVGSSFWIDLPATESGNDLQIGLSEMEQQQPLSDQPSENYNVLYIEDNQANIKLVRQILDQLPHVNLIEAHTPNLGIDKALHNHPDLVLLDINMPGKNGYQVLKELKSNPEFEAIPFIAVTANALSTDIEKAKNTGFDDHISKPFKIEEFLQIINRFLNTKT